MAVVYTHTKGLGTDIQSNSKLWNANSIEFGNIILYGYEQSDVL